MKILAIETSCDETAIAIIDGTEDMHNPRFSVLSNVVLSQVALHAQYGGVFPSLAKREHARNLVPLLKEALEQGLGISNPPAGGQSPISKQIPNTKYQILNTILGHEPELLDQFNAFIPTIEAPDIDLIAVTNGPGLEPALWVGVNFAKALSLAWRKPVMPINHMEGHFFSALLKKGGGKEFSISNFQFPILALLISGGHTELVLSKDWFTYEIVGQTRDDAVGEAFDKVARMLDLPYPGGPQIARLAQFARNNAEQTPVVEQGSLRGTAQKSAEKIQRTSASSLRKSAGELRLPRPMMHSGDFNFSFSGLKTAVLYALKKIETLTPEIKRAVAYAFEEAVTEVLVKKTIAAAEEYGVQTIIVGGGVSANTHIRKSLEIATKETLPETKLLISPLNLTGDNALMIATAGYLRHLHKLPTIDIKALVANGNMRLGGNENMVQ